MSVEFHLEQLQRLVNDGEKIDFVCDYDKQSVETVGFLFTNMRKELSVCLHLIRNRREHEAHVRLESFSQRHPELLLPVEDWLE